VPARFCFGESPGSPSLHLRNRLAQWRPSIWHVTVRDRSGRQRISRRRRDPARESRRTGTLTTHFRSRSTAWMEIRSPRCILSSRHRTRLAKAAEPKLPGLRRVAFSRRGLVLSSANRRQCLLKYYTKKEPHRVLTPAVLTITSIVVSKREMDAYRGRGVFIGRSFGRGLGLRTFCSRSATLSSIDETKMQPRKEPELACRNIDIVAYLSVVKRNSRKISRRFQRKGRNLYIPELAKAEAVLFGAVAGNRDGSGYEIGDSEPFIYGCSRSRNRLFTACA